jgi:hypothetical protein
MTAAALQHHALDSHTDLTIFRPDEEGNLYLEVREANL